VARIVFRGKVMRCRKCNAELATYLSPWRALFLFLTIWGFIGSIPFFFHTKFAWPVIVLFTLVAQGQLAYLPLVQSVQRPLWQGVKRNWPYFAFSIASLALGLSLAFIARSLRS